ncbi:MULTISPECIES: acetate kinase [unclassified Pseudodesulfovibrio]|uniref:acetate/propionate family kinase n=1 Tax=unclassified Pseudodesulfovibrio TaxID=2661612 RepID=UPI000FEBCDE5|nr:MULTISPECIES: acetate kinase [unclassified Pseudodesulfovibrio]MCJ2164760.1 acetate kinase [Pseudodesulfovibrio sp. S3-i]RWU04053.1 acetate kinase [Pseudodesulfovibrio sp. S3]
MNILVINCGSSSLKYQLRDMETHSVTASGIVERIGESMGRIVHKSFPEKYPEARDLEELPILNHEAAMKLMVARLTNCVIQSPSEIDAIGHRVVQGGEHFSEPVLVDDEVIRLIDSVIPLAPLHGSNLTGIRQAMELFPGTPNVVVFDTEFHQTIPRHAHLYPIPMALYDDLKIRKYGFHGTSHKYVTKAAAAHLGKGADKVNLITIHLGNGCSMAAVRHGKCMDTTMGLTPLAGLMMGTRCGDIDPAVHAFLAKNKGYTLSEIDTLLNKSSGLLGICGYNDMRDIHQARDNGDQKAQLAFEMFAYRVKTTIGAYRAIVGRTDALVFTAGIGENDRYVRALACQGLESLGIKLDPNKNDSTAPGIRSIHADDSQVRILIIPTDEELEIAEATVQVVNN